MKKELLFSVTKKDFKIDYFSGKGAGGQHRNRHKNCVRLRHPDSGAYGIGQSHRERRANLREALSGLTKTPQFKTWLNRKAWELIEKETIEEKVEKSMHPKNLKTEVYNDGWVEENL